MGAGEGTATNQFRENWSKGRQARGLLQDESTAAPIKSDGLVGDKNAQLRRKRQRHRCHQAETKGDGRD